MVLIIEFTTSLNLLILESLALGFLDREFSLSSAALLHNFFSTGTNLQEPLYFIQTKIQFITSFLVLHRVQEVHKLGRLPHDAAGLVDLDLHLLT